MWVSALSIDGFRNFKSLQVLLSPGINIIYGGNAQGKTNLLEAVGLCATGRSIRAGTDVEMINFDAAAAHVRLTYEKNNSPVLIDAIIQKENGKTKKYLSIDHVPIKKWNEFLGRLPVVSFSPDDLQLIKAGPSVRRVFLDAEISQLSRVYYNDLKGYNRALKQRNHLIKHTRKAEELSVWDEQLVKYGSRIMGMREKFVCKLGEITQGIHLEMTGGVENLSITYKPNIPEAAQYAEVLAANQKRDLILGSTTVGVHRDDCHIEINHIPARVFGSQGQQRTAALSVKLAEVEIIKQSIGGQTPVLLLDDVLSELDKNRQKFLMNQIGTMQVLLTCTGVEDMLQNLGDEVRVMRMENGSLC